MKITPFEPKCTFRYKTCPCKDCLKVRNEMSEFNMKSPSYRFRQIYMGVYNFFKTAIILITIIPLQVICYSTIILPIISYILLGHTNIFVFFIKNQQYAWDYTGSYGHCVFKNEALNLIFLFISDGHKAIQLIGLRPTHYTDNYDPY